MIRKGIRALAIAAGLLCGVALASPSARAGGAGIVPPGPPVQAPAHQDITDKGGKVQVFFSVARQKEFLAQQKAHAGLAGTNALCTPGNLIYNTGAVMRNPANFLIFWQPPGRAAFPAGYQAAVEKFFQDLSGTPLYNIVTQYNDSTAVPVPNLESLGAPSFTDTTTAAPSGCNGDPSGTIGSPPDCPLTDGDIQNEVDVALAANPTWPKPGPNVEYFVYTPSDVGECDGSTNSSGQFNCFASNIPLGTNQAGSYCAYHGDHTNGSTGPYAFQPFDGNGNCFTQSTFPNGQNVDPTLGATSHEMIESNTDPFLSAWRDVCGAEIGDKCAYQYGYIVPTDGTNIVLSGDRYQIQQEWSNDISGCAKRYGDPPTTSVPASIAFGEVEGGTTAEKDVLIQNNGGGDLNILNVRLASGSNPDYSLLNVPPSAATLHTGDTMTVKVQFAPPGGAPFANPTASLIVDTDDPAQTTYTTSVTGTVGVAPIASCAPAIVNTDPNLCTAANASINAGSTDPDGEAITLTQSPAGPYTLGTTAVTLTVTDTPGLTASCANTVTVKDAQLPTITCPAPQTVQCTSSSGAMVGLTPTFSDNCPGVTAVCTPPSGSTFGFGTTPISCTATDGSGNTATCNSSVTVADVPPVIQSVVASPNVLRPPNKKLDPVTILVKDTDACDPNPVCSITSVTTNSGPAPSGSVVITGPLTLDLRASGNGGHALTYIITVTCSDAHGGSTAAQTTVQAPL